MIVNFVINVLGIIAQIMVLLTMIAITNHVRVEFTKYVKSKLK